MNHIDIAKTFERHAMLALIKTTALNVRSHALAVRRAIGDMISIQHGTIQPTRARGTPMAVSAVSAGLKSSNTFIVIGYYAKLDLPQLVPTEL